MYSRAIIVGSKTPSKGTPLVLNLNPLILPIIRYSIKKKWQQVTSKTKNASAAANLILGKNKELTKDAVSGR